jgi:hypothetical protein
VTDLAEGPFDETNRLSRVLKLSAGEFKRFERQSSFSFYFNALHQNLVVPGSLVILRELI